MNLKRILVTLALTATACLGTAGPAHAAFGLIPGSVTSTFTDQAGEPFTQAGGHPFAATTSFALKTKIDAKGREVMDGNPKNLNVDLPVGFVGNPQVTPYCADSLLETQNVFIQPCPAASQVGTALVVLREVNGTNELIISEVQVPVYNVDPNRNEVAAFTFSLQGQPVHVGIHVRPEDNGLRASLAGISEVFNLERSSFTLWGVPADHSHDEQRGQICVAGNCVLGGKEAGIAPKPLLRMPTDCGGGALSTKLSIDSYQDPDTWFSETVLNPPVTGCDKLSFDSSLSASVTSHAAGAPTGLGVDLEVPQLENPVAPGTPDLRKAVVTLPEGMAVSTASADGQAGCSDAQFAYGTDTEPTCPLASKIGEVTVKTPVFKEPMSGEVFLGTQTPTQLLRLMVALHGPGGLLIKLPARIDADPRTGQLTTTFESTPQLPFESFLMNFKSGSRAPLVTPASCGTYTTRYELTAWSGQVVRGEDPFVIDESCGRSSQFTPALEAGTTNPVGGAYSPFTLRLTRPDGQANVASLEATLPEGLLAKLAGVPLCGDAQAASGDCPSGSQVGTTTVGTGPGSNPLYVPQPGKAPTAVYLAGPYRGAPYSLVVKVPAQAGPFDLGTVAVRNALYVDEVSSRVTAKSDALPQILQGIPISYRDIRVEVNRPEFVLNPTSCDRMQVSSTVKSSSGQSASPSSRFQVGSCESLSFQPKLALNLKGAVKRSGHPALKAVLTFPQQGRFANIQRAQVGLPHSLFLDQGNIGMVCTQPQLRSGSCPAASIYGKAKAWTPLLDRPLEGPVYLGVGYGHKLPDLVADLGGQIRILLNGRVDTTKHEGLRNTFEAVPDAPVSRFVLEMKGGKKFGLIENSENLCRKAQRASVAFAAHSGRTLHLTPVIGRGCGGKKKPKKG